MNDLENKKEKKKRKNTETVYDKALFGERLTNLRKLRWNQYVEFLDKKNNPFLKYECCKSQETFAAKLDVERRTVGKWELGKSVPSFDDVLRICQFLECNVDYLLGREELSGFSPVVIASHYSCIDKDIIELTRVDAEYRDFLNFFMKPINCYDLIQLIASSEWKKYLSTTQLNDVSGQLKATIEHIFQQYLAFTPINEYSKGSFKNMLISKLSKDDIIFNSLKLNNKIYIPGCMSKSLYNNLGFSKNELKNYNILIDYIVDYCFDILFNITLIEIQKEKIGNMFLELIEKCYSEE